MTTGGGGVGAKKREVEPQPHCG